MIVVSLLLILVAVTLLVLGLTGGSSGLLISSIVASLVAAVFLVVGARQAAAARREAPAPPDEPRRPADENSVFVSEPEFADADGPARRSDDLPPRPFAADSGVPAPADDQRDTVQFDPGDLAAARPAAGPDFAARSAAGPDFGTRPADEPAVAFADQVGAAPAGDLSADEPGVPGRRNAEDDPDYDRASAAINSARSETPNEDAWRREPSATSPADEPLDEPWRREPQADAPVDESWRPDQPAAAPAGGAWQRQPGADVPVDDAWRPETPVADEPVAAEEFAEPDADDPDDEPLPQAVRPADAVGVARLEAEVMVVDGRPRYHLPECPSLVGRLAEPIPVREAVELGFSPCGLCRPVDRLVGATARR